MKGKKKKKAKREMFALRAQNVLYVSPTVDVPERTARTKASTRNGRNYFRLKHVPPSRNPSGLALGLCGF